MKPSIYNHIVQLNGLEILYNTISNKYVILSDKISKCLSSGTTDFELKTNLQNQNFIVNDDINEQQLIESLFLQRRYSSKIYQLILNTSLDCNLSCWYCYETHLPKSFMSIDLANKIVKHIEIKFKTTHFELLDLSFFGGEPMMNYKVISFLLNSIKNLSKNYKFKVHLTFVTNGTLISQRYIDLIQEFPTRFQVTIDGNKERHNSTRKYKNSLYGADSYSKIIEGLHMLNCYDNFYFTIRVNYDNEVLENIKRLVYDIDFLNRCKSVISLHKIWQYKANEKDSSLLINIINYFNKHNFVVNTFSLHTHFDSCYADNYNQAVINYDGSVYKCTARNFAKELPVGYLNSMGFIEWRTKEINKRLALDIPEKCKQCTLLPSCPGICSQKKYEKEDINEIYCPFDKNISKDDIILLNIKQQLIIRKNENL